MTSFTIEDIKNAFEAGKSSEFHNVGYDVDYEYVYSETNYTFEKWIETYFQDKKSQGK